MKSLCVDGLNNLKNKLNGGNYSFVNKDFNDFTDAANNSLMILDPPYILRQDMYDTDFTKEIDDKLLKLISNTKNDFIYFNYLERDGVKHEELIKVVEEKNFRVIDINNKTLAGQGRSANVREVQEVIVTNVE